jgi:hypothetical protein
MGKGVSRRDVVIGLGTSAIATGARAQDAEHEPALDRFAACANNDGQRTHAAREADVERALAAIATEGFVAKPTRRIRVA